MKIRYNYVVKLIDMFKDKIVDLIYLLNIQVSRKIRSVPSPEYNI